MASSATTMLFVIVCYDVATDTAAGRRRLRRVAKLCEAVGQRVQQSVFECRADLARLETLERELLAEIEPATDALRFYRLTEPVALHVKEYGCFKATDFTAPLVL